MPDIIDDSALTQLRQALNKLMGEELQRFKDRMTYYAALAMKGVIQPYKPQHEPVIWPSEKARRYYFAMRREKGLPLQYTRGSDPMSQRLSASWAVRHGNGEAILGNRATYAPYVASEEYQTEQHAATGFITDAQAAEKVIGEGTLDRIITAQIQAAVRGAFRGLV